MGFFDSVPQLPAAEPERLQERPVWMRMDAVPGSVPAEVMLFRTGAVAAAIGSVRAYPNGFEFTLHVRLRHRDETLSLHSPDWLGWSPGQRAGQVPEEALRLGVLYADGRRAATTSQNPRYPGTAYGEDLVLHQAGGGGSSRTWTERFWVHPLPPGDPVTFVASWTRYGVAETRAELDGTAICEAARRAVVLWPEDLDQELDGDA